MSLCFYLSSKINPFTSACPKRGAESHPSGKVVAWAAILAMLQQGQCTSDLTLAPSGSPLPVLASHARRVTGPLPWGASRLSNSKHPKVIATNLSVSICSVSNLNLQIITYFVPVLCHIALQHCAPQ